LRDLKSRRTKKYLKENAKVIRSLIRRWRTFKVITKSDVVDYLLEVNQARGGFVANKELRFIKALFNHAIAMEWATYNPCTGIKPFPIDSELKYIPPEEDVRKILEKASPKQKAYVLVAIHSLGRSSSINNLRWDDVFEDHLVLRTRKCKNSNVKKIKIPLNDVLKDVLSQIPHDAEYVFVKRTGEKFDYRDKLIPSLCRKAKVRRFTLHCLRHFAASKLDNTGTPLTDIQALLGHEAATTTAIYLQSVRGSTAQAVKRLEDIT
jgi:integrase